MMSEIQNNVKVSAMAESWQNVICFDSVKRHLSVIHSTTHVYEAHARQIPQFVPSSSRVRNAKCMARRQGHKKKKIKKKTPPPSSGQI
jgi:hypothetical protein